jgi:hypothetical protein
MTTTRTTATTIPAIAPPLNPFLSGGGTAVKKRKKTVTCIVINIKIVHVIPIQFHAEGSIVNVFSSVAHVWVPGAKTTGPIVKKFVFSLI